MKTSGEREAGIGHGMMGKGEGHRSTLGSEGILGTLDSQQETPRSGKVLDAEEVLEMDFPLNYPGFCTADPQDEDFWEWEHRDKLENPIPWFRIKIPEKEQKYSMKWEISGKTGRRAGSGSCWSTPIPGKQKIWERRFQATDGTSKLRQKERNKINTGNIPAGNIPAGSS